MSLAIFLKPYKIDGKALRHVDAALVWHKAAGVVVISGWAVGRHPLVAREWRPDAQGVPAHRCAGLLDGERFWIVPHLETDAMGQRRGHLIGEDSEEHRCGFVSRHDGLDAVTVGERFGQWLSFERKQRSRSQNLDALDGKARGLRVADAQFVLEEISTAAADGGGWSAYVDDDPGQFATEVLRREAAGE